MSKLYDTMKKKHTDAIKGRVKKVAKAGLSKERAKEVKELMSIFTAADMQMLMTFMKVMADTMVKQGKKLRTVSTNTKKMSESGGTPEPWTWDEILSVEREKFGESMNHYMQVLNTFMNMVASDEKIGDAFLKTSESYLSVLMDDVEKQLPKDMWSNFQEDMMKEDNHEQEKSNSTVQ
jgi:hypothetical protein